MKAGVAREFSLLIDSAGVPSGIFCGEVQGLQEGCGQSLQDRPGHRQPVTGPDQAPGVDELLDRALRALAEGNRATANHLAEQVLAVDRYNVDAEDLLAAPADPGEIRRITILFADLVDSTALSTRIEPETYRTVVGRYRDEVRRIVERYGGHIGTTKGDGLLAFFGHPEAHEDDVRRAVQAGLDITHEVAALSARVRRRFGFDIDVRVGVHRGIAYLDTKQDDVYGFAANLAARVCSLAEPGTVAVSQAVEGLIRSRYRTQSAIAQGRQGSRPAGPLFPRRGRAGSDSEPRRARWSGATDEIAYLRRAWAAGESRRIDHSRGGIRRRGRHRQEPAGVVGRRNGRASPTASFFS